MLAAMCFALAAGALAGCGDAPGASDDERVRDVIVRVNQLEVDCAEKPVGCKYGTIDRLAAPAIADAATERFSRAAETGSSKVMVSSVQVGDVVVADRAATATACIFTRVDKVIEARREQNPTGLSNTVLRRYALRRVSGRWKIVTITELATGAYRDQRVCQRTPETVATTVG